MKQHSFLLFFLLAASLALLVISGCLYHQNKSYKSRNRQLILENDSILSVNLELIKRQSGGTASLKQLRP
jgi:hypothetical protein